MTVPAAAISDSKAPRAATTQPKGRTLVAGATGFIGRFVTEASLESGRPTFVLVRPSANCPAKAKVIKDLEKMGAVVVEGAINKKESMEKILRENEIEVVISAVGGGNILDQIPLVEAIKSAPSVERFLPSEFGHDVDRADPVEPGLTMYKEKRVVRRAIEEAGVPFTHICCNSIASWPYHDNTHPSEVTPPMDRFQIYGDGSVKAYFVAGPDIGKFTMKIVDDPRTLNKMVHFRPPCNYLNINELASLWEKKIGKTLPRVTVSADDLLAAAAENCIPQSVVASFTHDIFIKGCQADFEIEGPNDVEIGELYPNEAYKTMDECFEEFALSNKEEKFEEEEEQEEEASEKKKQKKEAAVTSKPSHVMEILPIPLCVEH